MVQEGTRSGPCHLPSISGRPEHLGAFATLQFANLRIFGHKQNTHLSLRDASDLFSDDMQEAFLFSKYQHSTIKASEYFE